MAGGHDPVAKGQVFQLKRLEKRIVGHGATCCGGLGKIIPCALQVNQKIDTCVESLRGLRLARELPRLTAMSTQTPQERGWRGSADLWLDAAYQLLTEGGVEAVKVMPLAERLGLSRTSFYWHFADREALLDGLIARWETKNTANLIAQTRKEAATITEAALHLCDCWFMPEIFDDRLEFAIRTWALTDPKLRETLSAADAARIAAIKAMFRRFDYSEDEAEIRAYTVYLTQIGYISMRFDEPLAARVDRAATYAMTFTGRTSSQAEIDDFCARHAQASRARKCKS